MLGGVRKPVPGARQLQRIESCIMRDPSEGDYHSD
jgi:hypothetical protein